MTSISIHMLYKIIIMQNKKNIQINKNTLYCTTAMKSQVFLFLNQQHIKGLVQNEISPFKKKKTCFLVCIPIAVGLF